jgi:hypothetical protein
MALLPNCVHYWPVSEDGTDDRVDIVNGADLTPSGSLTSGAAKLGNGVIWNGEQLECLSGLQFNTFSEGPITIAAWFMTTLNTGNTFQLWDVTFGASNTRYGLTYNLGSDWIKGTVNKPSPTISPVPALTVNSAGLLLDTWQLMVYKHDQDTKTVSVSLDGGAFGDGVYTGGGTPADTGKQFALANTSGNKADDAAIWNRLLSDADVAALYNSGAGLAYPFGESLTGNTPFFMFAGGGR